MVYLVNLIIIKDNKQKMFCTSIVNYKPFVKQLMHLARLGVLLVIITDFLRWWKTKADWLHD